MTTEQESSYEDMGCYFDPCVLCDTVAPLDGVGVCNDCNDTDMVVTNLPTAPAPGTREFESMHDEIVRQIVELQGDLVFLLEELAKDSPAPFSLGDLAGDIRNNSCHLWNLLVSVQNGGN